jgi:hypothetical protein
VSMYYRQCYTCMETGASFLYAGFRDRTCMRATVPSVSVTDPKATHFFENAFR